jgi:hypothetical protein
MIPALSAFSSDSQSKTRKRRSIGRRWLLADLVLVRLYIILHVSNGGFSLRQPGLRVRVISTKIYQLSNGGFFTPTRLGVHVTCTKIHQVSNGIFLDRRAKNPALVG